jgi:3'-phosphoadenosine 5'-phosphosulfate sulfotransferase (PAPS reductase)/FAD synthetase
MPAKPENVYVAFGGGVNSTAMLIGLVERGILPRWVVFADTGGERPETYAHVLEVWQYCTRHLIPFFRVSKSSMYRSLEDECLQKKTMPSIVFGWRSCSDKWKQEPQRKFLNHDPAALAVWDSEQKITRAIGFGVDELHRIKPFEDEEFINWYPLYDWRWNRNDCIEAIKRAGLTVPPKSACFYCPASTKLDVKRLALENPELYRRALAMEENAEKAHTAVGLGRHFTWKELVGPETVEQSCLCFDGE